MTYSSLAPALPQIRVVVVVVVVVVVNGAVFTARQLIDNPPYTASFAYRDFWRIARHPISVCQLLEVFDVHAGWGVGQEEKNSRDTKENPTLGGVLIISRYVLSNGQPLQM